MAGRDEANISFVTLDSRLDQVRLTARHQLPDVIARRETAMCDVITLRCAQIKTDVSLALRDLQMTLNTDMAEANRGTLSTEWRRQIEDNHRRNVSRLRGAADGVRRRLAGCAAGGFAAARVDRLTATFSALLDAHKHECTEIVNKMADSEKENFDVIVEELTTAKDSKLGEKLALVTDALAAVMTLVDKTADRLRSEVKAEAEVKKTELAAMRSQLGALVVDVHSAKQNLQHKDLVSVQLARVRRDVMQMSQRAPRLMARLMVVNAEREERLVGAVRQMLDENIKAFLQQNADHLSRHARDRETKACRRLEEKRRALVGCVDGGATRGREALDTLVSLANGTH